MTNYRERFIATALVVAAGRGNYKARQIHNSGRRKTNAVLEKSARMALQNESLQNGNEKTHSNRLAGERKRAEAANSSEVLKLRGTSGERCGRRFEHCHDERAKVGTCENDERRRCVVLSRHAERPPWVPPKQRYERVQRVKTDAGNAEKFTQ